MTPNSIVCERHFRSQDILHPSLLVNGVNEKVKSLAPYSLPQPTVAIQSASDVQSVSNVVVQPASDVVQPVSDVMPLKTNVVPELRSYEANFKRQKAYDQLSTKKIKIDVLGM